MSTIIVIGGSAVETSPFLLKVCDARRKSDGGSSTVMTAVAAADIAMRRWYKSLEGILAEGTFAAARLIT